MGTFSVINGTQKGKSLGPTSLVKRCWVLPPSQWQKTFYQVINYFLVAVQWAPTIAAEIHIYFLPSVFRPIHLYLAPTAAFDFFSTGESKGFISAVTKVNLVTLTVRRLRTRKGEKKVWTAWDCLLILFFFPILPTVLQNRRGDSWGGSYTGKFFTG